MGTFTSLSTRQPPNDRFHTVPVPFSSSLEKYSKQFTGKRRYSRTWKLCR